MVLKKYDMGLISVTAMGIGSVVGAGIFALLGEVILQAGNLSYYSFIIAGIAAMFSGYSYAKLSGKYPDSVWSKNLSDASRRGGNQRRQNHKKN